MARSFPNPLGLTRSVLTLLGGLNLAFGVFVLGLFLASWVPGLRVFEALGFPDPAANPLLVPGGRLIMLAGIVSVPIAWLVLTRLAAIVDTVRSGDPFVAANAGRLQLIAWALLGLELLHLVVGAVIVTVSTDAEPLDIDWNFSVTGWLAVLLLFVLARVFDHGTRLREDLEGTV